MRNIIFMVLSLLLLAGCSTTFLNLNKSGDLHLGFGNETYLLSDKIIEKNSLNFKDLFVNQYKLQDASGRVLFYEDARTALNFEFNVGGLYSVMSIFDDAKEYEEFYSKNNLRLVQIKLKNREYVNVLIQESDSQIYSFVYGFCNEEFSEIAQILKVYDRELPKLKYEAVVFSSSSKPLTNWNDKMVYFTPLIVPLRSMGRL
ncbi:MAG: hypothetical protein U9Q29_01580 [Campylobacterota bacterium]|nr:hypothetical protein [Campylobacterota bacterium]